MYRKLVLDTPAKPVHVILMGDLNYRIKPFENWSGRSTSQTILNNLKLNNTDFVNIHHEYNQQRSVLWHKC